jgi:hypothetical protein
MLLDNHYLERDTPQSVTFIIESFRKKIYPLKAKLEQKDTFLELLSRNSKSTWESSNC